MTEIPIRVCGDYWLNAQTLTEHWPSNPSETVVLRLSGEGPSLWHIGVVDAVLRLCNQHGRAPGTVWVGDWSNRVEEVPFARFTNHAASHFFWMSDRYRHREVSQLGRCGWFGFFMGRANMHRARMLQDLLANHAGETLVSVMKNSGLNLPKNFVPAETDWLQEQQLEKFHAWCTACDIPSLDSHAVQDQYDARHNTNQDILEHYPKFLIEIVAETYTQGNCFFPTEKTVRPLSQGKGMLIYGPKNFLKRLRDLGFRTYDSIWNEDYDGELGHRRWQLMLAELAKIVTLDRMQVEKELSRIHAHNSVVLQQLIDAFRPG